MEKENKSERNETERQAIIAAYLFAEQGLTQSEIAEHLEISQSEVSRRLRLAEGRWLSRPRFVKKELSESENRDLEASYYRAIDDLRKCVVRLCPGGQAPAVSVFHSGLPRADASGLIKPAEYAKAQTLFGRLAALQFRRIFSTHHYRHVGVAWGSLIGRLTKGLDPLSEIPRDEDAIFFPISGEPMKASEEHESATSLAMHFQKWLGSRKLAVPELRGVISCINDKFVSACIDDRLDAQGSRSRDFEQVIKAIKCDLLGFVEAYRRIFLGQAHPLMGKEQPAEPLISSMDALITGVGTASKHNRDPWLDVRIQAMQSDPVLTQEDFEAYMYGDIAGVYLLKPNLPALIRERLMSKSTGATSTASRTMKDSGSPGQRAAPAIIEKLNRVNEIWTGIQHNQIKRCAERARADQDEAIRERKRGRLRARRSIGVIVVAIGRHKAEVLAAALAAGLINYLIIDQDLAEGLMAASESLAGDRSKRP